MPKKTIVLAIIEALNREGGPCRVDTIYKRIAEDDLYRFNAANPEHIVRTQLRRHSENLDFPTAKEKKYFVFLNDGLYWIKGVITNQYQEISSPLLESVSGSFNELRNLHQLYIADFKKNLLEQLKRLNPYSFEEFCKRLLIEFGFRNVEITRRTKDGGIDGYGELKIGLVFLNVAFECKRYHNTTIGRPKVSQFRGDILLKQFQQGIFFTTSKFSEDAKNASLLPNTVPVILIDGQGIVDLMIEKNFGVERKLLPVFTNAIDLIFENKD